MAYKRDNNELLFFLLRQLVHEQTVYLRNRFDSDPDTVEILESDLIDRVRISYVTLCWISWPKFYVFFLQARQINILNLKPFYESEIFKANRFTHDVKKKIIIQTL